MQINIAIAALAVTMTNAEGKVVLDYKLDNYTLDADVEGVAAAIVGVGTNVRKLVVAAVEAQNAETTPTED